MIDLDNQEIKENNNEASEDLEEEVKIVFYL